MNINLIPLKSPAKGIRVKIPGSKSYTNRALILAALTKSTVEIINPLFSDDTSALISCLKNLGIVISVKPNSIVVIGDISQVKNKEFVLDANLSATTMRFILALSCIIPGIKNITGKPGLLQRPIKDLVSSLQKMGAKIKYTGKNGFPPVKVISSNLNSKEISLSGEISSQFVSAILMISPKIGGINLKVNNLNSKPYVSMTIEMMKQFGVKVENVEDKKFVVEKNQEYKTSKIQIEGDFSSATYFGAIALLTKSTIILENLKESCKQADRRFFEILQSMGNKITYKENEIIVEGKGIKPVSVNMADCPDSIQTLAVMSAFAKGQTKISGIQTLKYKETDRLNALRTELKKMNIKTEVKKNILIIYGGNPKPTTIETYGDHRMAMAFAVAGSKLGNMQIENPRVVNKTFPDFWITLEKLGVKIERIKPTKFVLVGFMGAGKSSVAPLLARKLQKDVIEMDNIITNKSKRKSIAEIFKKDGEKKFRTLEFEVAKNLEEKKDIIVSTGGGVIMNDSLMKHLKHNGLVIFLDATFDTIKKRLTDMETRPLWKNPRDTEKLFNSRLPLYKQYADIIVSTDGKSLGMVTQEIIDNIEKV